ncbi:MAG: MoxR family ATPase, partial [Armatimonadetes bacterium]|nr:MoxR family ATPase [Armatimonadota bacterium]
QEHAVTAAGTHSQLEEPFFVLATQNPIEMEGTYPLPEAQLDRFFFKLRVTFPGVDDLMEIIDRTTVRDVPTAKTVASGPAILAMQELAREVPIASHVKAYVARFIHATHPEMDGAAAKVKRFIRYGASPRAAQALVLGAKVRAIGLGRYNVSFEDIHAAALPALRHRLILNFEGEAEGIDTDSIVESLLEEVPELVDEHGRPVART